MIILIFLFKFSLECRAIETDQSRRVFIAIEKNQTVVANRSRTGSNSILNRFDCEFVFVVHRYIDNIDRSRDENSSKLVQTHNTTVIRFLAIRSYRRKLCTIDRCENDWTGDGYN